MVRLKFKFEFNPKNFQFSLNGIGKISKQLILENFEKQMGYDGKAFPKKKDPKGSKSSKFLYNTGKMVNSLTYTEKDDLVKVFIKDKTEIYKKYLSKRAKWLGFNDKQKQILVDQIMENWKKNKNKKKK